MSWYCGRLVLGKNWMEKAMNVSLIYPQNATQIQIKKACRYQQQANYLNI